MLAYMTPLGTWPVRIISHVYSMFVILVRLFAPAHTVQAPIDFFMRGRNDELGELYGLELECLD